MNPRETIARFDAFLQERSLSLDAVLIGGAALDLLGVVSRQTRDCDILHPALPPEICEAARAFAAEGATSLTTIGSTMVLPMRYLMDGLNACRSPTKAAPSRYVAWAEWICS